MQSSTRCGYVLRVASSQRQKPILRSLGAGDPPNAISHPLRLRFEGRQLPTLEFVVVVVVTVVVFVVAVASADVVVVCCC